VKFRCDRDALSEALQTVQRGVSSRPGIPALTGVLLDGLAEGRLTMTTTDLEVSARLTIDVQVSEPGIALIPARLLADTVKSLSDAPVDVETDQSQARIRCAAYEGALRLLPAEDFPGLQEPGGTRVEADAGAFAVAVSQVARAASRDEARPVLTGVLVEVSREGCVLVATDSYRLAVRDLVASADGEAKAIVPERGLRRTSVCSEFSGVSMTRAPIGSLPAPSPSIGLQMPPLLFIFGTVFVSTTRIQGVHFIDPKYSAACLISSGVSDFAMSAIRAVFALRDSALFRRSCRKSSSCCRK